MAVTAKQLMLLGLSLVLPVAWVARGHAGHDAIFPMPEDKAYVEECGSCHTAYAPGLLPARSWDRMMAELHRHFGEDASLEPASRARLAAALRGLAADSAGANMLMRRIAAAVPAGSTTQRITETGFFKYMHDEVPAAIWKRPKIGNPANCGACHVKANEGRYPEEEVRIPK
ncbi:MAG: cytochrome C [Thiobacillus sp.]|nr:cytochrome C [Thiobacillus sp.]